MWYKILFFILLFPIMAIAQSKAKQYKIYSPNKKIEFTVKIGSKIWLTAKYKQQDLLDFSEISMQLENQILGKNAIVNHLKKQKIKEVLYPVIREKQTAITNNANELRIDFKDNYYIILRAYNNGFAYRFGTTITGEITIISETGKYKFPENHMVWWGKEKQFQSHNQVFFDYKSLRQITSKDLSSLPLIIHPSKGPKIVITETDLRDYPGMWLRGSNTTELFRVSAKYPKTIETKTDRKLPIIEREKYIAKTTGTRTFPWRIFAIGETDADLITNQLTYILASPNKLEDISWIKPGKVAWDWWNANNIYGVDFKAGINTQTYKYYIDFASKYGIENILLDEGWYKLGNMSAIVPEIDMEEIISYANKNNVGIILWCVWKTLDNQLESSFEQFKTWGIKGIKVDFMNRDDQEMVNYYPLCILTNVNFNIINISMKDKLVYVLNYS